MKMAIIRGRGFTAGDKAGARRVAVVNEEFAKTYWPKQDPIGKRFRLNDSKGPWVEVVGLTRTNRYLLRRRTSDEVPCTCPLHRNRTRE